MDELSLIYSGCDYAKKQMIVISVRGCFYTHSSGLCGTLNNEDVEPMSTKMQEYTFAICQFSRVKEVMSTVV